MPKEQSYETLAPLDRCYIDGLAKITAAKSIERNRNSFKDDAMVDGVVHYNSQLLASLLDMKRVEVTIANPADKNHSVFKFCQAAQKPMTLQNIFQR